MNIRSRLYKFKRKVLNPRYYRFLLLRLIYRNVIDTEYKKNVSSMFLYSSSVFYWFKDNASSIIYEHDLKTNSIVVEAGGYKGNWCLKMNRKYNCTIFTYEPIYYYFAELKSKTSTIDKVIPYNYGLGRENKKVGVQLRDVQTTTLKQNDDFDEIVEIRDVCSLDEINNLYIDLMHINIEGGEYELIKRIIESNMIIYINSLQIQFHEWYPSQKESKVLRKQIHDELKKTHQLNYSYDFVWEKWSKKV